MLSKKSLLIVAVALSAASATQAQGQMWGGYNAGFYGGLPYSVYVLDSVPYYALHPPVYYSHIVRRPYGYSPYAYPPGIMTPERSPGAAQTIDNSQVRRSRNYEALVAQVEPKTIINPYVSGDIANNPRPVPRRGKPAPKTIHPIELAKAENKLAG
jgi:hypothetical protein